MYDKLYYPLNLYNEADIFNSININDATPRFASILNSSINIILSQNVYTKKKKIELPFVVFL